MNTEYFAEILENLLSIHSPLGYHEEIIPFMDNELRAMGYTPKHFKRGGLSVSFGKGKHIAISCHLDEIGLSVRQIKENGRMTLSPHGGIYAKTINDSDAELVTLDGSKYYGTIRHEYASVHMAERDEYGEKMDLYKNMEFILDELVSSKEEVEALGIHPGDYLLLDPRTKFTESGFIKSRFIDDKACVAIVLAALKEIAEKDIQLNKKITVQFSVYEENGTGGATGLDDDVEEMLALDIGCAAKNSSAEETKVSIIAKDSRSPYSRQVIQRLKRLADEQNIAYTIDVNYPHYGSDVHPAVNAGHDMLYGLIGPGTYASHGYERTHIRAIVNTYRLLMAYLMEE